MLTPLLITDANASVTLYIVPSPPHYIPSINRRPLVRGGRLLARLQLVQVPPADGQVALVLCHAVVEALDVASAGAGRLLALLHLLVLLREVGVLGRSLGGCGATAEEAAKGVADGGADCDTAGGLLASASLDERRGLKAHPCALSC
jgi:hypothetical protein